jgi:hypothetical protein
MYSLLRRSESSYLCWVVCISARDADRNDGAQHNNSFNRSANSVDFIRETMLLWRFVAPG